MRVESVHNVIGWFNDALRIETRRTYRYDKGNDVAIVERRTINVTLYNKKGQLVEPPETGLTINQKV